jgi:hypothetical protein
MITLAFTAARCLDGLALVNGCLERRSGRREPVHVITADLEDPVALQFVNARGEAALVSFMSRYMYDFQGIVDERSLYAPDPNLALVRIDAIADLQKRFEEKLISLNGPNQVESIISLAPTDRTSVSFHLRDGKPQMMVQCNNLFDFMRLEAGTIGVEGSRLVTCGHCGNLFLAGQGTSRRADALHCSDKCRVAAMRARKKEGK